MDEIYEYNGKQFTLAQLEEKYGDKVNDAITKFGFTKVENRPQEETFTYKNKTFTRSQIEEKYGDKTDQAIEKFGFESSLKKKESSKSTSTDTELVSETKSEDGSLATQKPSEKRLVDMSVEEQDALINESNKLTKSHEEKVDSLIGRYEEKVALKDEDITKFEIEEAEEDNYDFGFFGNISNAIKTSPSLGIGTMQFPNPLYNPKKAGNFEEKDNIRAEIAKEQNIKPEEVDNEKVDIAFGKVRRKRLEEKAKELKTEEFIEEISEEEQNTLKKEFTYDLAKLNVDNKRRVLENKSIFKNVEAKAKSFVELRDGSKAFVDGLKSDYEKGLISAEEVNNQISEYKDGLTDAHKEFTDLSNKYEENLDKILKSEKDISTRENEVDLFKREYNKLYNLKEKAINSFGTLGANGIHFILEASNEFRKATGQDFQIQEDTYNFVREQIDNVRENIKRSEDGLTRRQSLDDIDGITDVEGITEWALDTLGEQTANTVVLVSTGGTAGLITLGVSSAGAKLHELETEEKETGKKYSNLQKWSVSLLAGIFEGVTEKISLGQVSKGLRAFKSVPFKEIKKTTTEYLKRNALKDIKSWGIDVGEEALGEEVNRIGGLMADSFILGKDVNFTEGFSETLASSVFMSGLVYKTPAGIKMMKQSFMGKDTNQKLGENTQRIAELTAEIKKATSQDAIDILESKKVELANENLSLVDKAIGKLDDISIEEKKELIAINAQQFELRKKYDAIKNDNGIDAKTKESLIEDLSSQKTSLDTKKDTILNKSISVEVGGEKTDFNKKAFNEFLADDKNVQAIIDGKTNVNFVNNQEASAQLDKRIDEVKSNKKTPKEPKTNTDKSAYDFDDTLFDNSTQQLNELGEEVKAKIENGEDVTIVSAREDNSKNRQLIADKLGVDPSKIKLVGKDNQNSKKAQVLDELGIDRANFIDVDKDKQQGVANGNDNTKGVEITKDESEKELSNETQAKGDTKPNGDVSTGTTTNIQQGQDKAIQPTIDNTTSESDVEVKPTVKRINPKGVKGEFDVEFNDVGNVSKITTLKGREVSKWRYDKKTKKPIGKNANYSKIEAEALGVNTTNQEKEIRNKKLKETISKFEPSSLYEKALLYFASGGLMSAKSAKNESGYSANEVKWVAKDNKLRPEIDPDGIKENDLKTVERIAESLDLENSLEARDEILKVLADFKNREAIQDELIRRQEEIEQTNKDAELDAYLNSLNAEEFAIYEAHKAEKDYLSELSDKEALEYLEEQYGNETKKKANISNDKGGKTFSSSVQERTGEKSETKQERKKLANAKVDEVAQWLKDNLPSIDDPDLNANGFGSQDQIIDLIAKYTKALIAKGIDIDTAIKQVVDTLRKKFDFEVDVDRVKNTINQDKPNRTKQNLISLVSDNGSLNYSLLNEITNNIRRGSTRILSPYIQEGRQTFESERRTIQATLILEANKEKSERNLGNARETKSKQEKYLKDYAKKEGIWIDYNGLNNQTKIPGGKEAKVFLSNDKKTITKVFDYTKYSETPLDFLNNRISLYNSFFADTPYELIGFTETEKGFSFVVEQPYIDGNLLSRIATINIDLQGQLKRLSDFVSSELNMKEDGLDAVGNETYRVMDLHLKNAIEGTDGNIYVIDAIPELKNKNIDKGITLVESKPPKGNPSENNDDKRKKSLLTKAATGEGNKKTTDALKKHGLDYSVENQEEAKKRAKAFVKDVGVKKAIELLKSGVLSPGAELAFIYSEVIDSLESGIENAIGKDKKDLESDYSKLQEEIFISFDEKARDFGRFISALNNVYNSSNYKYNLTKQIEAHKARNNGEIDAKTLAKFKERDARIKEFEKQIKELETKLEKAEAQQAVDDIKESIDRENGKNTRKNPSKSQLKKASALLRKAKFTQSLSDLSKLQSSPLGAIKGVWDGAVEVVAKALDAGSTIEQAIKKGINKIKSSDWYKGLSKDNKKIVKQRFEDDIYDNSTEVATVSIDEEEKIKIPKQLIRDLVESGINDIDQLSQKILDEYLADEDVTLREVRDAITGYGKTINPTKDELSEEISRLKNLGRIISGMEDVLKGNRPKRSGLQRRKITDEERRKQNELKDAMRDLPLDEGDLEKQWKTQLDAVKSRLKNQIRDLEHQIKNKEKSKPERTPLEYDQEANDLKRERDELKEVLESIVGKPELSYEQRVKRTEKALQTSIDNLESDIKLNKIAFRTSTSVTSDKIKALKERQAELRAQLLEMRKASGLIEQRTIANRKKAIEKRLAELQEKRRNKDYSKKQRKAPPEDAELKELQSKYNREKEEYDKEAYTDELKNRHWAKKALDQIVNVAGLQRVLLATGEFSFVFLQNAVPTINMIVKNPVKLANIFARTFKSYSKTKFEKDFAQMEGHELYDLALKSKLALTKTDFKMSAKEEVFQSDVVTSGFKLIGDALDFDGKKKLTLYDTLAKKLGKDVSSKKKHSISEQVENINPFSAMERFTTTYSNHIKIDLFEKGVKKLEAEGKNPIDHKEDYKRLAKAINTLTGRANLGQFESITPSLNALFFSVRFAVSTFNKLNPIWYGVSLRDSEKPNKPSVAQKLAISQVFTYITSTSAFILAIQFLAGEDDEGKDAMTIESNPTSSDFGKLKIGNIRFDPWGGHLPWVVLMSRMLTGEMKRSNGKVIKLGEGRNDTRLDKMIDFAKGKANPTVATGLRFLDAHEDIDGVKRDKYGNEVSVEEELKNLYPIYWQGIKEVIKENPEQGKAVAYSLTALGFLGVNNQVYGSTKKALFKSYSKDVKNELSTKKSQYIIPNINKVVTTDKELDEQFESFKNKHEDNYIELLDRIKKEMSVNNVEPDEIGKSLKISGYSKADRQSLANGKFPEMTLIKERTITSRLRTIKDRLSNSELKDYKTIQDDVYKKANYYNTKAREYNKLLKQKATQN